jgi:hypothetical protein
MPAWSQVTEADYRRRSLRAHRYLADVPVYDVWRVDLPGAERPCTMVEVRATIRRMVAEQRASLSVRSLFALRRLLGRLLGWDTVGPDRTEWSWRGRLAEADVERSIVAPGTLDGPFSVLYVHASEAVSETRNETVHAFLVLAVEPAPGGHALLFAIHVLPVSAWTRPYLALIRPFRHWIVYPSLLRQLHDAWLRGGGPAERASGGSKP